MDGEDGRLNSGSLLQNLLTPALTAPASGTAALFAGTLLAEQENMRTPDTAAPQDGNLSSPGNYATTSDAGAAPPATEEQSEELEDPAEESGLAEESPEMAPTTEAVAVESDDESQSEGPPRLELPSEEEIEYVEDSEESDPLLDAVAAAAVAEVEDSPARAVKEIEKEIEAQDIEVDKPPVAEDIAGNDADLYQDVEEEDEYQEAHEDFVDAEQHTNSV